MTSKTPNTGALTTQHIRNEKQTNLTSCYSYRIERQKQTVPNDTSINDDKDAYSAVCNESILTGIASACHLHRKFTTDSIEQECGKVLLAIRNSVPNMTCHIYFGSETASHVTTVR